MSGTVFTIGYAGITLPRFVEVLKQNGVTHLIDVRSYPRSQYFSAFNDNNIRNELAKISITYENWKNEFGARQTDKQFYTDNVLDFEKFAKSKQFQDGVSKAQALIGADKCICLMCAEIDPLNCHRAILCGKTFGDIGQNVVHIIAKRNGEIGYESHKDLEQRLVETYRKQTDNLQVAYKEHNKKIGYNLVKK